MIENALQQLNELIPNLINGTVKPKKQNNKLANVWRKRSKKDGLIDWRMSAKTISNLVRALTRPYPGAEFLRNNIGIKIWQAEVITNVVNNIEPGNVIGGTTLAPIIKCGEDALKIIECEPVISFNNGEYL
jgi:methionyl-tRNA formyltransferase